MGLSESSRRRRAMHRTTEHEGDPASGFVERQLRYERRAVFTGGLDFLDDRAVQLRLGSWSLARRRRAVTFAIASRRLNPQSTGDHDEANLPALHIQASATGG